MQAIFDVACRMTLGDGARAKFWTDNWLLNRRSIATMAPALYSFVRDKGRPVREALHNRCWIRDITGGISLVAIAQYLQVWDLVQETTLAPDSHDRLVWKLTSDGQFSVMSAYKRFFMGNTRFACSRPIWKSKAPPRCKFFMWVAGHRKCLTADNLERRGWPSNGICPLCVQEPENCSHLFVNCRFTQQLWRSFRTWTGADFQVPGEHFSTTEDRWLKARVAIPKPLWRNFDTIAILIHWRIWKERNACILDNVASTVDRVLELIKEDIRMWRAAGCIRDLPANA